MAPIKEMALVDAPANALSIFERLASKSDMTVENLERLMQMHERMAAKQSEELFNMAMSDAQKEMRPIAEDCSNPQTRSRYASYAAIDNKLRPIYTKHGFGVSFDTGDGAPTDHLRLLCYVSHSGGHKRTYKVDMPADGKGAKGGDVMTKTHAAGAAMSYGMRYLLKMIFNVAVGEDDTDGNKPSEQRPEDPDDYNAALERLKKAAEGGQKAFAEEWGSTRAVRKDICDFATRWDRPKLEGFKATAQNADRAKKGGK